jgi:hypothetical protein
MHPVGPIAIVAAVSRVGAAMRETDNPELIWFGDAVALWQAGAPWEACLGLAGGWRDALRHRDQQTALAVILGSLKPRSARGGSEEIATLLRRYEASGWRSDQARGRRPAGCFGACYDYLTADGPTSAERIRRVLPGLPKAVL